MLRRRAPRVAGLPARRCAGLAPGFLLDAAFGKPPAALHPLCGFGARQLRDAARQVESALCEGDLEGARDRVRSLVGRDSSVLGPDDVARAVIESLAENSNDAVVAPLLHALAIAAGRPGHAGAVLGAARRYGRCRG